MIDPERLAAFALMTGATSIVPGASMLLVVSETLRRGWRGGTAALAGLQVGYLVWWLLAALGLGTLARMYPAAFHGLALAGAIYLGWLGVSAIRHAPTFIVGGEPSAERKSRRSFPSGMLVAIGNPKSLVYMVAILPPFIDARMPAGPQIVILALVAMLLDVMVGALYIAAGQRLQAAMARPRTATRVHRAIGALYLALALALTLDLVARGPG